MQPEETKINMLSNGYDIKTFLKATEGKDFSEIISFADQEATAAWRRAYRKKRQADAAAIGTSDRYEQTLEALIQFLRSALPYRPSELDEELFEQFLQIQQRVFQI